MLSLSGPKALLFLQLLIAFITRSVVNVCTISNSLSEGGGWDLTKQLGNIIMLGLVGLFN